MDLHPIVFRWAARLRWWRAALAPYSARDFLHVSAHAVAVIYFALAFFWRPPVLLSAFFHLLNILGLIRSALIFRNVRRRFRSLQLYRDGSAQP